MESCEKSLAHKAGTIQYGQSSWNQCVGCLLGVFLPPNVYTEKYKHLFWYTLPLKIDENQLGTYVKLAYNGEVLGWVVTEIFTKKHKTLVLFIRWA